MKWNKTTFIDYVAAQGFGEPLDKAIPLAKKWFSQGHDYVTIAHEIVFRGLTKEIMDEH